jgi:SAM-dependent methyltransferase
VFGFDAWHVGGSYSARAYKSQVVAIVNALRPKTVVEVGCGLGDIVRRVRASRKIGIDIDARVIRAARCLHPFAASWMQGTGRSAELELAAPEGIDCLIMVNWIHTLSPAELKTLIEPSLRHVRYLLVDAIDPDGPSSYRYKHDFDFLNGKAELMSQTRAIAEPRSFILFRIAR